MKKIVIIILSTTLIACVLIYFFNVFYHFGDDTLGGFPERNFATSKKNLESAVDSIYSLNPEFRVPNKWADEDTSIKKSYFFMEGRTFYFKNDPEEMYYVTFIGDSAMLANPTKTTISIRLVNFGGPKWLKDREVSKSEYLRIEERFDKEIISKLENYMGLKSFKSEDGH